ncbi:MAG: hypothetical protein QXH07_04185 [Thermoplasmata archaeon]
MQWHIKGIVKTLVLAPAVSGLTYIATNILASLASAVGALPSASITYYAPVAAGVAFAIVVVNSIDEMVSE